MYIDRHGINKQTVTNLTDGFIVYTAIVTSEVLFVRYLLSVESVDRDRIRLPGPHTKLTGSEMLGLETSLHFKKVVNRGFLHR